MERRQRQKKNADEAEQSYGFKSQKRHHRCEQVRGLRGLRIRGSWVQISEKIVSCKVTEGVRWTRLNQGVQISREKSVLKAKGKK